jgi:cyclase
VQPFELFPAIDLRHGKVVRLRHGQDDATTTYGDDPVATLVGYRDAGALWVHVVDLDAAFGEPRQVALIERLVQVPGRPQLQLGGGLRDAHAVAATLALGVERVVVGSMVARDTEGFAELVRRFPNRIVAGLDARDGRVATDGWRVAGESVVELAGKLAGLPLAAVLVTDVGRDGVLTGANHELAVAVGRRAGVGALLSGGVTTLAELQAATHHPELAGAVVGTALYEGHFGVPAALAAIRSARRGSSGLAVRVIPCLDVANGLVVKGVSFANLRDIGDPATAAARYAEQGADEIVLLDVTATVEARATRRSWVEAVARRVAIPLTVGGGVRSVEDARELLLAGADKVGVNSAAVDRPEVLRELAEAFGRQCVVLSVDARRRAGGWEVVTHGGRRGTGLDVLAMLERGVELGAGEILLTSIDADGTRAGYDLELLRAARARVDVPIIASGGAGSIDHLAAGLGAGADAVLAASIFHDGDWSVAAVQQRLGASGFVVREPFVGSREVVAR